MGFRLFSPHWSSSAPPARVRNGEIAHQAAEVGSHSAFFAFGLFFFNWEGK